MTMISSQNMTRGSYDSTEDNTQDLSSVKSYNLKSEPKSGAGVGVLDGFLYCVGGESRNVYINFF